MASEDWVLLEVQDKAFEESADRIPHWSDLVTHHEGAGAGDGLTLCGYPGAEAGFEGNVVRPTKSRDFRVVSTIDATFILQGPEETAPGMSGGGVFDEKGGLVAIHRSAIRLTLTFQAVPASHIRDKLAALGYELVPTLAESPKPQVRVNPRWHHTVNRRQEIKEFDRLAQAPQSPVIVVLYGHNALQPYLIERLLEAERSKTLNPILDPWPLGDLSENVAQAMPGILQQKLRTRGTGAEELRQKLCQDYRNHLVSLSIEIDYTHSQRRARDYICELVRWWNDFSKGVPALNMVRIVTFVSINVHEPSGPRSWEKMLTRLECELKLKPGDSKSGRDSGTGSDLSGPVEHRSPRTWWAAMFISSS